MRLWGVFLAAIVAIGPSVKPASAESGVIVYGGSAKGCVVKGIVRTTFEPPKTRKFLWMSAPPFQGLVSPDVIDDLKRKAAALGANRIIFRDASSEGIIRYEHGGVTSREWTRTTLIAEAVKC
jgi:hypothetical protein